MMKKTKEKIALLMAAITVVLIAGRVDTLALADENQIKYVSNVQTITQSQFIKRVKNDEGVSSMGGLSVATANNGLYLVKGNSDNDENMLFFYKNAYDSNAKPIRIYFKKGGLGHGNGMAIDPNYIYITRSGNSGEGNTIAKLSRSVIENLPAKDNYYEARKSIHFADNKKLYIKINGEDVVLGQVYEVYVNNTNTKYTGTIGAITRYSYNKETKKVSFLAGCASEITECDNKGCAYRIMTFDGNKMSISTAPNDTYFIDTKNFRYKYNNEWKTLDYSTRQDVFYSPSHGLYIPLYNGTDSYIIRVKLKEGELKDNKFMITPIVSVTVFNHGDRKTADGITLSRYEIESLAFLTKNSKKEDEGNIRVVLNCNRVYKKKNAEGKLVEHSDDAYEILYKGKTGNLV